jgi:hypothetical protein
MAANIAPVVGTLTPHALAAAFAKDIALEHRGRS